MSIEHLEEILKRNMELCALVTTTYLYEMTDEDFYKLRIADLTSEGFEIIKNFALIIPITRHNEVVNIYSFGNTPFLVRKKGTTSYY